MSESGAYQAPATVDMSKDVASLTIAASLALKRMPTDRKNFICPHRGPVSWDSLQTDEATEAVGLATHERNIRRRLKVPLAASPSEIDLLAALWFYGEKPELQHPVGRYDLDFYFDDYNAAIEVDGSAYHTAANDQKRDATLLLRHGIFTARVDAGRVWQDPLWAARHCCLEIVHYRRSNPWPTS